MVQIQDVTPAADDAASSGERLRLAGNAAYASSDFEAAALWYRKSVEAAPPPSPSAPYALGNRVKALLRLGRAEEALVDAEACVRACPSGSPYAAKARFRKGEALEATGAQDSARDAFRDAVVEAPGDRDALGALRRISEAINSRRDGDTHSAASSSTRAPSNPPRARDATTSAPAARDAEAERRRDDDDAEATFRRAKRALREERYEEACRAFEAYTPPPARPDRTFSLLVNRARARTELGRHEDALRDARAATRADEAHPRARYRLGVAALAAAEAEEAEATRLDRARGESTASSSEVSSEDAKTTTPRRVTTDDRRARARALAEEARDEGFGYGSRLRRLSDDDASAFAEGRDACERFLLEMGMDDEYVKVERELEGTHAPGSEPEAPEAPRGSELPSSVAATVPVASLAWYARRETARRETAADAASAVSDAFDVSADSERDRKTHEDDVARFRESVRVFGCAIVRLPASLAETSRGENARVVSPRDVFAEARAAASAFFKMRPAEKARSLPNARAVPHGYLRPLEETRVDSTLGSDDAFRRARRDETILERFSACAAFDAAYVWPSARFRARLDAARGVLEETAKAAGDAFLVQRFAEVEADAEKGADERDERALEAYETALASIVLSPENQRLTLAKRPDPKRRAEDDADASTRAAMRAALEPIVRETEAEPERNFLSFFPRLRDSGEGKARTPAVRVRRGDAETRFAAAEGDAEPLERDVLVVAGERFRDIMGESWTTPTVSFDGDEPEGPCVRLVYRV